MFSLFSWSLLIILSSGLTLQALADSTKSQESKAIKQTSDVSKTSETSEKIKKFMETEEKNLSSEFPYRLNLFKNGNIDKNKAGVRISETAKQFDDLGLPELLFYYKLYDNSMRVPHWHANATEVGVVLSGKMKITIWDGIGSARIFTVEKNGTWMIPQGTLHALENAGDEELDFIVAYNSGDAADRDFATAWAALPDSILEKSLGLGSQDIATLKKTTNNRLSLYDPASIPEKKDIPSDLSGNFDTVAPIVKNELGSIQRIDEKSNPAMKEMALQKTIINPSAMREPHWYIAGDTMLFVKKGKAYYTMMDNKGKVYSAVLTEGDLVFIPMGTFHAYVNIDNVPLEIYEAFNASKGLSEVTLVNGAKQFSPGTIASATGLSKKTVEKIFNQPTQNFILPF